MFYFRLVHLHKLYKRQQYKHNRAELQQFHLFINFFFKNEVLKKNRSNLKVASIISYRLNLKTSLSLNF